MIRFAVAFSLALAPANAGNAGNDAAGAITQQKPEAVCVWRGWRCDALGWAGCGGVGVGV
ncbi:hypothetical protein ANO14919_061920 [Xylariales sp. No.14919]|nr:hypothetical protein ANO14919_061920 [Xylariales sp. No.14919]